MSAVVGIILIIAITVILAAVISAFAFQLSSSVSKNKQISVEVKRTNTAGIIMVKTMSGSEIRLLTKGAAATPAEKPTYTMAYNGKDAVECDGSGSVVASDGDASAVGKVMFFTGNGELIPNNVDITVIVHFTDNTEYMTGSGNLA